MSFVCFVVLFEINKLKNIYEITMKQRRKRKIILKVFR